MPLTGQNEDKPVIFVNRRRGKDRREEMDRCKDMPMDLFHRKRRKSAERRASNRSLADDYMAFAEKISPSNQPLND